MGLIALKIAVLAPMPSASVTMQTRAKPGALRRRRSPYRTSPANDQITFSQPYSRTCSRTNAAFPNSTAAARRASSRDSPCATSAAVASSRKCSTSSATSRSAAGQSTSARSPRVSWRHNDMLLPLGLQQPRDGGGAARPLGGLDRQLLSAGARQRIEPRAPRVLGLPPFAVHPAGAFQPLQRHQQRAGIHLEHAAGHLLDAARDAEAVHWLEAERLQNEHVERALDDVRRLVHGASVVGFILMVKRWWPAPLLPAGS